MVETLSKPDEQEVLNDDKQAAETIAEVLNAPTPEPEQETDSDGVKDNDTHTQATTATESEL